MTAAAWRYREDPLEGSIAFLNLEHQSVLRLERGSTIKLRRLLWQRVLVNYRGNLITSFPCNWFPFKCVETSLDMHLLLELMGISQVLGAVHILEFRRPLCLSSGVHIRGFFWVSFPPFISQAIHPFSVLQQSDARAHLVSKDIKIYRISSLPQTGF